MIPLVLTRPLPGIAMSTYTGSLAMCRGDMTLTGEHFRFNVVAETPHQKKEFGF
jgi:hypothetical protein